MKTSDQIVEYVAYRSGLIYYHSAYMYGGDANGVNLLLWNYHEIWAEVVERPKDFRKALDEVLEQQDCGRQTFPRDFG